MEPLYVVDFTVQGASHDIAPFEVVQEVIGQWLSALGRPVTIPLDLNGAGEAALSPGRGASSRTVRWSVANASTDRALLVEVREEYADNTPTFTTRVDLAQTSAGTGLRISMGREGSQTWLSPASAARIHQPRLVGGLLREKRISLTLGGQSQDGRYLQVRSKDEVRLLIEALHNKKRLPILLVHVRTLQAVAAAKEAASRLVGLVRVVSLDWQASRTLAEALPEQAPDHSAGTLVWSDIDAPVVQFSADVVNNDDKDSLRDPLMRLVAPLTVLARDRDTRFGAVRRAQLAISMREASQRSNAAKASKDTAAEIKALREELNASRENEAQWQALAESEEKRAGTFEAMASRSAEVISENERLRHHVKQLQIALSYSKNSESEESSDVDVWAGAPDLIAGDAASAKQLFIHLRDASDNKIEFTNRASVSWGKINYPNPKEMTDALIALARAAATLYDGTPRSMGHLDTWLYEEFSLKVAVHDDTIEKSKKLREFTLDDESYDRTPHVKVADYTTPDRVGRIHFALDSKNGRVIVDHVGLKLY